MAYSLKYRAGWGVSYRSVTNSGENKNVKKKPSYWKAVAPSHSLYHDLQVEI